MIQLWYINICQLSLLLILRRNRVSATVTTHLPIKAPKLMVEHSNLDCNRLWLLVVFIPDLYNSTKFSYGILTLFFTSFKLSSPLNIWTYVVMQTFAKLITSWLIRIEPKFHISCVLDKIQSWNTLSLSLWMVTLILSKV